MQSCDRCELQSTELIRWQGGVYHLECLLKAINEYKKILAKEKKGGSMRLWVCLRHCAISSGTAWVEVTKEFFDILHRQNGIKLLFRACNQCMEEQENEKQMARAHGKTPEDIQSRQTAHNKLHGSQKT